MNFNEIEQIEFQSNLVKYVSNEKSPVKLNRKEKNNKIL